MSKCGQIRDHVVEICASINRSKCSGKWAVEQHMKNVMCLLTEVERQESVMDLQLQSQTQRNTFLCNMQAKNQEVSICK